MGATMTNPIRVQFALSVMAAALLLSTSRTNAATVSWDASSATTPDSVGYTLFDTATPEDPVLGPSHLTLSTDNAPELMFYRMDESQLAFPGVTEISFRMRLTASSNNLAHRAGAAVNAYVQDDIFTYLWIGEDEVLFTNGSDAVVASNTTIDTNDSLHDYLLRINGTNSGDSVSLFQDNVLILTSQLFTAGLPGLQSSPRIVFGEVTGAETGTSQWQRFSHNAAISAVPEPGAALLMVLSTAGFAVTRRRRV